MSKKTCKDGHHVWLYGGTFMIRAPGETIRKHPCDLKVCKNCHEAWWEYCGGESEDGWKEYGIVGRFKAGNRNVVITELTESQLINRVAESGDFHPVHMKLLWAMWKCPECGEDILAYRQVMSRKRIFKAQFKCPCGHQWEAKDQEGKLVEVND